jgi:hypothetical protein
MVASLTLLTYITVPVISSPSGRGVTPEVTLCRVYKEHMVASLTLLTYITITVISVPSGRGVTPEVTLICVYTHGSLNHPAHLYYNSSHLCALGPRSYS